MRKANKLHAALLPWLTEMQESWASVGVSVDHAPGRLEVRGEGLLIALCEPVGRARYWTTEEVAKAPSGVTDLLRVSPLAGQVSMAAYAIAQAAAKHGARFREVPR